MLVGLFREELKITKFLSILAFIFLGSKLPSPPQIFQFFSFYLIPNSPPGKLADKDNNYDK